MKRKIVNFGQSVRERLLTIARERNIQLEYLLLRYAFERFLYRLGKSDYSERFILKGASAFSIWMGPFCRVTRDADMESFGDSSPDAVIGAFKSICTVSCPEDAVEFDLDSFTSEDIKEDDKYPGLRVSFTAYIGGARVAMQIDVGFGDSVYPKAETSDYPVLLDGDLPRVLVYPRYTVVAEKFHTMVDRGLLNSRLKDYYDIWLLTERFDFEAELLKTAIRRTFERRETPVPSALPESLSEDFFGNPLKVSQWNAFLRKLGDAPRPDSLGAATMRIADFLKPVISASDSLAGRWSASERRWK
ncbi:MAG: nucleotidyl transferase AbiEii/AbiGii toxin family protein [Kiritimatiellae bacterium]|nr:nucleotidyl transferase AbiEii/AbiGii toxin family protein [Kiritimatiellia bacterium]